MRSYKRVSRLFVFSVMLSVIAVLGVLFFCLNVLFDVSLFRFAVLRAAARRFLFCGLGVLSFGINDHFDVRLCFVFASRGAETIILRYLTRINLLSIYDMIDVCCRGVVFRDTVLSDRDMVMVVCEYFRCPPLRLLRQDILRLGMRLCGFHSSVEAI